MLRQSVHPHSRNWIAPLFLLLVFGASIAGGQIAFPGAVGVGASATGGRAGSIYHVTNLNNSGSGSFRDAVSQSNRIVIFDVGGYIVLTSPVSVASNVTIFGQTAPGGGIGIRAREASFSSSNNIIVRGMRFRQGGEDPATGKSAVGISNGYNMIFDHCSIEFGRWDNFDAVFGSKMTAQGLQENITLQNSILALPIYQGFGAHIEGGPMTFYRNLWVDEHNRQPLAKNNNIYINNIIYNYDLGYTAGNTGGSFSHDIVNNYFIAGPSSDTPTDAFFQLKANQTAYAVGNMLDSNLNGALDGSSYNTVDKATASTTPWSSLTSSISTLSATDAFWSVVASAGAWPRDEVDEFVVNDVLSLGTSGQQYRGESASAVTNYPNSQANTGIEDNGYGKLASGTPFTSTSGSGIPDYWAKANNISTADANAGTATFGTSSYLNIEAYANSLILPEPWTSADLNSPSTQGASSYNQLTGTWILTGSGNSDSGADQGQISWQSWTADGSLTAELTALDSGIAGIQLRSSSAADAALAAISYTDGAISFLWRSADGGTAQSLSTPASSLPVYLKLLRQGSMIAGYYSYDNVSWTLLGTASISLSQKTKAGPYIASESSKLAVAQFKNVSLSTDTGSGVTLSTTSTTVAYADTLPLTAAVTSTTSTTPTGSVQFFDGNTSLSTQSLSQASTASWNVQPALKCGAHSLLASYSGDANNGPGFSSYLTVTVNQATPKITWNPSSSITYGSTLASTLNATATLNSATVAGTFTYTATSSSGTTQAVTASTVLAAGTWTLTASFAPSDTTDFVSVTTATATLIVNRATPEVEITTSAATVVLSNPVTFTATVASTAGQPSGSISFYDGSTLLGSATLNNSQAAYTGSTLTAGLHTITATYNGDSSFATASSALTETVATFSFGTVTAGSDSTNASSGASQIIQPGGTASYLFPITSSTSTGLPLALTFSVSGLPTGATATLAASNWTQSTSTSWTLAANTALSGNVQLDIHVPATTASLRFEHMLQSQAPWLGLLLLPCAWRLRRARKHLGRFLALVLVLGSALAASLPLTGCGSTGYIAQNQKSYSVVVTVTAGTLSKSTNLSLTVE